MVLISWMIFSKIFNPKQITGFMDTLKKNSSNRNEYRKTVVLSILWFSIIVLFLILNVVPAILISYECNKGNMFHLILSILFSDIYIFHYTVRKFVFRDNYCKI